MHTYQKVLRLNISVTHSNTAMNVRQSPENLSNTTASYTLDIIIARTSMKWIKSSQSEKVKEKPVAQMLNAITNGKKKMNRRILSLVTIRNHLIP